MHIAAQDAAVLREWVQGFLADKDKTQFLNYQPVWWKHHQILPGKRAVRDRFALIDPQELEGKTVVDFGSNLGTNCHLAIWAGARKAIGLEFDPVLVEFANGVNDFIRNPCIFELVDLSEPVQITPADVGFLFAIDRHVKDHEMLANNIVNNVKKTLYYETHRRADIPSDLTHIFSDMELLGFTEGPADRKFYKCQIRGTK